MFVLPLILRDCLKRSGTGNEREVGFSLGSAPYLMACSTWLISRDLHGDPLYDMALFPMLSTAGVTVVMMLYLEGIRRKSPGIFLFTLRLYVHQRPHT